MASRRRKPIPDRRKKPARPELAALARTLRTMRAERELKQLEVAKATGIAESQLSEIERGVSGPTFLMLERIVRDGLGATFADFAEVYEE